MQPTESGRPDVAWGATLLGDAVAARSAPAKPLVTDEYRLEHKPLERRDLKDTFRRETEDDRLHALVARFRALAAERSAASVEQAAVPLVAQFAPALVRPGVLATPSAVRSGDSRESHSGETTATGSASSTDAALSVSVGGLTLSTGDGESAEDGAESDGLLDLGG